MERGYVKLWRKTLDSGLLQNATAWQVFGFLLLKASHKHTRILVGTTPVDLAPGQIVTGRQAIAKECKLSEQNVRTALALLKKLEILTIQPTNKYSIVSFVNWETYQQEQPANQPAESPAPNQHLTSGSPAPNHKQECKNVRNKKEENKFSSSCVELSRAPAPQPVPSVFELPLNTGEKHPITQADVEHWHELYPAVDIMQALRSMLGWLEADPKRRKTKAGINKFIHGWLSKDQNRGPSPRPMQQRSAPRLSWQEEREQRELAEFLRITEARKKEAQNG